MRILLDECVPESIKTLISGHEVRHVHEMGWQGLKNGELVNRAQSQFDVLLTTDRNLPYQQNVAKLGISVLIVSAASYKHEDVATWIPDAIAVLPSLAPGQVHRVPPADS